MLNISGVRFGVVVAVVPVVTVVTGVVRCRDWLVGSEGVPSDWVPQPWGEVDVDELGTISVGGDSDSALWCVEIPPSDAAGVVGVS